MLFSQTKDWGVISQESRFQVSCSLAASMFMCTYPFCALGRAGDCGRVMEGQERGWALKELGRRGVAKASCRSQLLKAIQCANSCPFWHKGSLTYQHMLLSSTIPVFTAQPWGWTSSKDSDLPAGTWQPLPCRTKQGKGDHTNCLSAAGSQNPSICTLNWAFFPAEASLQAVAAYRESIE